MKTKYSMYIRNKQGISSIPILTVATLFCLISLYLIYVSDRKEISQPLATDTLTPTPTPNLPTNAPTPTSTNLQVFSNDFVSFNYPLEMELLESENTNEVKLSLVGPNQPPNAGVVDMLLVSIQLIDSEQSVSQLINSYEERGASIDTNETIETQIGVGTRIQGMFTEPFDIVYFQASSSEILIVSGSYAGEERIGYYQSTFQKIIESIQL